MIGAGNIMFGSLAGPWNHSFRVEHKLGPRLKVTALIDPDVARARAVLDKKIASFVTSAYKDTVVYKSLDDYAAALKASGKKDPKALIVGTPPQYRGGISKGRNLEIDMLKFFPNVAYFIEKPVTAGPVNETWEVAKDLKKNGNIVSVGYMLRYLRCVQKMKQIIHENNMTVMATNARYVSNDGGSVALDLTRLLSLPRTSRSTSPPGGTSPRTWDPSLSRARTCATSLVTLAVTSSRVRSSKSTLPPSIISSISFTFLVLC